MSDVADLAREFREKLGKLEEELGRVVVGQRDVVRQTLVAILAGGHVLLEGTPGLGKTLLCRSMAEALDLQFRRIQFTPDLMPADILGTLVVTEDEQGRKGFEFQAGPIFGNLILADEINRATPKTQSALLEAMQEGRVTTAGEVRPLPDPFFVLATQNPIEMEGTYPLPEAQLDRFLFKIDVPSQGVDALVEILRRTTGATVESPSQAVSGEELRRFRGLVREVPAAEPVLRYAARLVRATNPGAEEATEQVKRFVRYGSSPRGAQAIVLCAKASALLAGRSHVDPEDIAAVALPALRHRVLLNFEGEAEGVSPDAIVGEILERTPQLDPKVASQL
ncbi:MAG TPA: AAA family ATPase [Planctomycetes bacterium]|mgnify:CR=1 FL=1|nr:AAA family ATPase [Planctomycetota bacterium]